MIKEKVRKWGNSQGLRLSNQVLDLAEIAVGDDVEIVVDGGQIVVKKAEQRRFDLADLVSRIPDGMRIGEVDSGLAIGREAW